MTAPAITLPAAGTKITVTVTAEHIARGRPCGAGDCAIALAIIDAFPDAGNVTVWPYEEAEYAPCARMWTGPGSWQHLQFGADAREFMDTFDEGGPVEPAVFEAEVAA